ncbi:MAG: hypothetical protein KKH98_05580, partial [Spirochaetes bacterium]|nr:hypothetical protein [Spirochaetota bacterium]
MYRSTKKVDYLLYISSFLSLLMIVLLLTSSKSISYSIDKNEKQAEEQSRFTIYMDGVNENSEEEDLKTFKDLNAEPEQKPVNPLKLTQK